MKVAWIKETGWPIAPQSATLHTKLMKKLLFHLSDLAILNSYTFM
jgi:hypothetical protein